MSEAGRKRLLPGTEGNETFLAGDRQEVPLAGGRQKASLSGRRRGEENGGHVVFYPEIWYHKNEIITQSDIHRVSDCLSARKPKREKGRLKYGNMEV
ncbi:hypothetical protein B6K86_02115 [Lachnospiraceae bacterium]|nr:hypothetical protein B6K86_02115 [Lachnospiraceae bacterium]